MCVIASCMMLGGCGYAYRSSASIGYSQFTVLRTTFQNKPLVLNFVSLLNADCSSRTLPVAQIVEDAKNGIIKTQVAKDYTNFPTYNQRAECNKKKSPGLQIEYVPSRDFVGTDTAVVDIVYPDGTVLRNRFNLIVR